MWCRWRDGIAGWTTCPAPSPCTASAQLSRHRSCVRLAPAPRCGNADRSHHIALQLIRIWWAQFRVGGARMLNLPSGNIFVTGATGFLGSHFVREWLRTENGHIFALARAEGRSRPTAITIAASLEAAEGGERHIRSTLSPTTWTAIDGDVTQPLAGVQSESDGAPVSAADVDVFWHFASDLRLRGASITKPHDGSMSKARSMPWALAVAIGVKRFVYVSTAYVCGRKGGLIEETPRAAPSGNSAMGTRPAKRRPSGLFVLRCERLGLPADDSPAVDHCWTPAPPTLRTAPRLASLI